MLAKLTSKNQLTLPKAVVTAIGNVDYFDVTQEDGRIVLTPVRIGQADAVRAQLNQLEISEADVTNAISWARQGE
jgi:hypothetical protein